jgi:BON domain-containing protein
MRDRHSRDVRPDVYRPSTGRSRRDALNQDVPPDERSLFGERRAPPASAALSEEELVSHGYYGQGYPIYGQPAYAPPRGSEDPASPEYHDANTRRDWFSGSMSAAHALGYTTTLRPRDTDPSGPDSRGRAGGHSGKGPKGYTRADERIREDVCDRLSDDDEVDASDMSVSVSGAEVSLEGTVLDRYTKRRAEQIALSVRGVIDVHNELSVQKSLLREVGDKLTGEAAEHHGHHGSAPSAH